MSVVDQSTQPAQPRHPGQFQPGQRVPWQFKPGKSGNPSGTTKADWQLAKGARIHGPEMLALCVRIARDEDAPLKVRLQAADMILDRGCGKPTQSIDARIERHKFVVVAAPTISDPLEWQRAYGAPLIEDGRVLEAERPKRIRPHLVG